MGINGYAYVDNDYHCMICDEPEECNSCDNIRVLPWVQDVPFSFSDGIYFSLLDLLLGLKSSVPCNSTISLNCTL